MKILQDLWNIRDGKGGSHLVGGKQEPQSRGRGIGVGEGKL